MEIKGQISEFIYQNEINSYTIAILETEEDTITVVGYLPFINIGDCLKLIGKFVTHQEYGEQFKIDTFEKIMPETIEALESYLSSGVIKGVGPSTARKIVGTFGDETINIFKLEPYKLSQIKGITEEKAIEISQSFIESWELWQIVGFLEKFGVSISNAKKVYKELGLSAIEKIEKNPYVLIDIIKNIDFKKVDKMAMDLGIKNNDITRIKSAIKYSLIKITYNGHCCALKENLINFVKDLLLVNVDDIINALIELNVKEEIIIENRDDAEWVYLYPFHKAEINIAQKISILNAAENIKYIHNFTKELEEISKKSNIELSEKQIEAVKAINENNVTIITGGPGTGKTTIIKTIIQIYKLYKKKVILCAPTGRAAKRMTEATGEEARTLHRVLEIGKFEDDKFNIEYEIAPIDADVIVVDEMSMVDIFLMNYLLKAIFQGTKLILVGDVNQLPSVGPGSVLKDLINSEKIVTIKLNKIFRQAAKSKIVLNAHRVNKGDRFIDKNSIKNESELKDDFFYINEKSQDKMLYQVISLCKERLKNYGDYDFFKNIQVLSPTKKGMLGTKELNKILQQNLNPWEETKKEKKSGELIFREGDRIMQIKNNYDIFWERSEPIYENGSGVFNGELGTICKIDEIEKAIKVKFDDDKVAWYLYSELEQLEHAYVITIHKAQGSEFDVVIVVIPPSSPILLTRNLLYTSITRARKLLIVIGSDRVINFMIDNSDNKKRNTGLESKLRSM